MARGAWLERVLPWLGFGSVLLSIAIALSPTFADLDLYGGHDWDEMSAHRLLTVKALLDFGQLPLWMPYACGGFSEWGNVQGATNLVSPWLPAYLLLDLRHALRVELLGTVLVSAIGTWLLAGEFTRSAVARTLACLVFVVNGRFALQAATGHLWHLQYCYLPWVFWAFERVLVNKGWSFKVGSLLMGSGALAMLVYSGGIYPLPHAVVLLSVYAATRSALERSLRPLALVAVFGAISVGLSAPKLFAVATDFGERPRLVPSTEAIDLGLFWDMLVGGPAPVPQWGWHEYGIYIGWAPVALLVLGAFWPSPKREQALKLTAVLALVLGFGAFHDFAPWTLLHKVSIFRSQHVPTRWLYPAVLCFGVAAAAWLGRLLARSPRRPQLELLLMAPCLLLAIDIGREASTPLTRAFWMRPRAVAKAPGFQQFARVPRDLQYQRRDYAPEAVPALLAGVGVLQCTMHASLNIWAPKADDGRPIGQGARGKGFKQYRGEAFTLSGMGRTTITDFSPNRVEVDVSGARPGDRLVVNQNFDPGWSVNGRPVESHQAALSTTLEAADARLVFSFWPRGLSLGIGVLLVTCSGLGAAAYLLSTSRRTEPHR